MSASLSNLWEVLAVLPGRSAARLEWQALLDDDWAATERFLKSTGRLARGIGCPFPGGDGCPRKIIRHADGQRVAVCGERPQRCERMEVSNEAIEILSFDASEFSKKLRLLLQLSPPIQRKTSEDVVPIGVFPLMSGVRCPVFLALPNGAGRRMGNDALPRLSAAEPTGVLFVGRGCELEPLPAEWTQLGFDDVFASHGSNIKLLPEARSLLEGSAKDRLPAFADRDRAGWRLPADAHWGELQIEFVEEEVLRVTFRGETRRFEPENIGLKSRKNGRPMKGWFVLKRFAESGGVFGWRDRGASSNMKKQKQLVADKLRACFGIEDDPLPWVGSQRAYVARLVLRDSRNRGPARRR